MPEERLGIGPCWCIIDPQGRFWTGRGWMCRFDKACFWPLKNTDAESIKTVADDASFMTGIVGTPVLLSLGSHILDRQG